MNQDILFLTAGEALAAIRQDFNQYAPQVMLFRELLRLIHGEQLVLQWHAGEEEAWLKTPRSHRLRHLTKTELVGFMCSEVASAAEDLSLLAAVCSRVFRSKTDISTQPPGILLETGMEAFRCQRCGRCCRELDYHGAFTRRDYRRLHNAGRNDILECVAVYPRPDGTSAYRIWVRPGTRELEKRCPFLQHESSRNRWLCRIHTLRPDICRQYPLSRKHAAMTGCPGFDQAG
jgi:Fe-S-cluster containining protein